MDKPDLIESYTDRDAMLRMKEETESSGRASAVKTAERTVSAFGGSATIYILAVWWRKAADPNAAHPVYKLDLVGPSASAKHTFIAHAAGCGCVQRNLDQRRHFGAELLTLSVKDLHSLGVEAWGSGERGPVHLAACAARLGIPDDIGFVEGEQ